MIVPNNKPKNRESNLILHLSAKIMPKRIRTEEPKGLFLKEEVSKNVFARPE